MFIDSHCHLDFPDLVNNLDVVLETMRQHDVLYALCISVNLHDFPKVLAVASSRSNLYATVGVHPDYENVEEPDIQRLVELASHPKVIGIGETGLDYYRLKGDLEWQRERFRVHIRAAVACNKPLIIHTREASADTLRIMKEEGAERVGGILHCFTESLEVAQVAIEMGFYISFSGIVTFKSATTVQEVARRIPMNRILIETDSPYLAPIPYRGKTNQPAWVKHVAESIAKLRGISAEDVGRVTSANFSRLFGLDLSCS